MKNSKSRAVQRGIDSMGRLFYLDYKLKLLLDEQRKEDMKLNRPRMPLWLCWVFRILCGGVTV